MNPFLRSGSIWNAGRTLLNGKLCESTSCMYLRFLSSGTSSHQSANIVKAPAPIEKVNEPPIGVSTPVGQEKNFDPKIKKIVDDISQLTLLQVSDLNELLKKTLNIPDMPMMGAMPMGAMASAPKEEVAFLYSVNFN